MELKGVDAGVEVMHDFGHPGGRVNTEQDAAGGAEDDVEAVNIDRFRQEVAVRQREAHIAG